MFCRKCGAEIDDEQANCPYCGAELNREDISDKIEKIKKSDKAQEIKEKVLDLKPTKSMIIAVGAALAVVIIVICAISGAGSSTNKMKKALKDNDYVSVQVEYSNAMGDSKKLKKMDKLIAEKLEEMIKDIDKYNFKDEAQNNEQAIYVWLDKYGTLMTTDKNGSYYDCGDFPFNNCISINNQPLWTELCGRIRDVQEYCDGVTYYKKADYFMAIERLSCVQEDSGCYSDSQDLITESLNLYMEAIIKEADSYMQSGDYETAIKTLNEAASRFKNNEALMGYIDTINQKMSEVKAKHADSYAAKAEECFKKKDAYSAVSNINFALELSPNNATYQASKAKYEQYLPFELYKEDNVLKRVGSFDFYQSETANDNSEYQNIIRYDPESAKDDYIHSYTYKLGGKYDTVSGKAFVKKTDKNDKVQTYIVVYADGKKIYTSPTMTAGVLPSDISFNVSGVDTLEIQAFYQDAGVWSYPSVYISNFVAQKEFK